MSRSYRPKVTNLMLETAKPVIKINSDHEERIIKAAKVRRTSCKSSVSGRALNQMSSHLLRKEHKELIIIM